VKKKPLILVVVGPTATGKSALAIALAKRFGGEVISADSRQVYRDMDLGTGKVTTKEMAGIPHHLLDIEHPSRTYSVERFKRDADAAIQDILARGAMPIICGGTGFYVDSIVHNVVRPDVPANKKLRAALNKKSLAELQLVLKALDPKRFATVDQKNPVRLIRAIEIATALGAVPQLTHAPSPYRFIQIGIECPDDELRARIEKRLDERLKKGMIAEVRALRSAPRPVSMKRLNELGLEYRYIALHLAGKLTKTELRDQLATAIWHYARRQKTWFRRDKTITWFTRDEVAKIEKHIRAAF
jgi:tRNA dimethylallyltransferase